MVTTKSPPRVVVVGAGPGVSPQPSTSPVSGLEVTVVEKDAIPGGRMKGLTLGDGGEYALDTGPSILQLPGCSRASSSAPGSASPNTCGSSPWTRIPGCTSGMDSQLDTSKHPERFEVSLGKLDRRLPMAMRRWMEVSHEKYGIAYERFMATPAGNLGYYAPWRLLPTLRFKPWQSLYAHLDEFFHDDRVTYALAYPSKYLGLHPTTCSSVFSVIPYIELAFGVWHVQGGFRALARGCSAAPRTSGRFRFSSPVRKVWIDAAHTRGVELESGERIEADAVVVNADLPYAATRLVDPEWRDGTRLS